MRCQKRDRHLPLCKRCRLRRPLEGGYAPRVPPLIQPLYKTFCAFDETEHNLIRRGPHLLSLGTGQRKLWMQPVEAHCPIPRRSRKIPNVDESRACGYSITEQLSSFDSGRSDGALPQPPTIAPRCDEARPMTGRRGAAAASARAPTPTATSTRASGRRTRSPRPPSPPPPAPPAPATPPRRAAPFSPTADARCFFF